MPKILCPLYCAAQKHADIPAIISQHHKITFRKLNGLVESTSLKLQKFGIKQGDRVAIVSSACPEYLILLLSLWRLGAIACPLNARYPQRTLIAALKSIHCQALFMDQEKIRLPTDLKISQYHLSQVANMAILQHQSCREWSVKFNSPATIMFTSGTTSTPKSVLHNYGNHYYNAKGSNENIVLVPGNRWLLSLPLYHVAGIGILFRCLLSGASMVIPLKHEEPFKLIKKFQVTHLSLVCTQLHRLLQKPRIPKSLVKIKAVLLGGGFIPQRLIRKAISLKLPIYKTYGLTETASQVTTTKPNEKVEKLFTAGRVLKYRQVSASNDGEILVKGKVLFYGYLTGNKWILPLSKNGWFKTGDMGYFDKDGYLVVTGRKDTMFISGGENIYPEEIEKALSNHKSIAEALVVPVADSEFGFRPVAFVKTLVTQKMTSQTLRHYLKDYLPRFKIPDQFYRWPRHLSASPLKMSRHHARKILKGKYQLL